MQIGDEIYVPWPLCLTTCLPMILYSSVNVLGCDNGSYQESTRLLGFYSTLQYILADAVGWGLNILLTFPLTYPVMLRILKCLLAFGDGPVRHCAAFFGLLPGISIHLYVRRLDLGLLDSCCGGLLPNAASMFPPGNNLLGHPMHLFVLTDGKGKARKTWHRVAVSEDKSRHMRLLGSAVRGAGLSHKGNKSFPC